MKVISLLKSILKDNHDILKNSLRKAILNNDQETLEAYIAEFGINYSLNIKQPFTLLDLMFSPYPHEISGLELIKDVAYIDSLLSRGAIAPYYEKNHELLIYCSVPLEIKNKYFTCVMLNSIYENKILSYLYFPKHSETIIADRIYYLIFKDKSNPSANKICKLIDQMQVAVRVNQHGSDYFTRNFYYFEKLLLTELRDAELYWNAKFTPKITTVIGKNFKITNMIKEEYFFQTKNHNDKNIELKFYSLLTYIYSSHPAKSFNLIDTYFEGVDINKFISIFNNYFFTFALGTKNFLPLEIKISISSFITANFVKEIYHENDLAKQYQQQSEQLFFEDYLLIGSAE